MEEIIKDMVQESYDELLLKYNEMERSNTHLLDILKERGMQVDNLHRQVQILKQSFIAFINIF